MAVPKVSGLRLFQTKHVHHESEPTQKRSLRISSLRGNLRSTESHGRCDTNITGAARDSSQYTQRPEQLLHSELLGGRHDNIAIISINHMNRKSDPRVQCLVEAEHGGVAGPRMLDGLTKLLTLPVS